MDESTVYQVTIKSANQKVDDYATKCESNWTVKRLKQHISETHINKPNIEDQRLIYAGNLLKDTHTLKQVFFRDSLCTDLTNSNKNDFTIHLVCTQKAIFTTSTNVPRSGLSSNTSRPSTDHQRNPTVQFSSQTTNPIDSTNRASNLSTNNPSTSAPTTNNGQSAASALLDNIFPIPPQTSNASSTNTSRADMTQQLMQSEHMRQQLALFQQLANMVAAQIVSVARNGGDLSNQNVNECLLPGTQIFGNGPAVNVRLAPTSNNDANDHLLASRMAYAGENRQPAPFGPADPRQAGVGMDRNENEENNNNNANAPVMGDPAAQQFRFEDARGVRHLVGAPPVIEPANQNDMIDWVYFSVKAIVLMAAIFLHASIFRILFILALLAIAYFFNRRLGRRGTPARRDPPPANVQPPQRPQRNDQGTVDQGGNGARDSGAERNNSRNENTPENDSQNEVVQGRIPFLKFCYLVVTDFLASLLPE